MTADLKPYLSYRYSKVEWLGDVPEHWAVKRNKLFLREVNDPSPDGSEELLTVSQYTGITRRRERLSEEDGLLTNAASLTGYKRVQPGDLVVNIMLAWNGSLGVSAVAGIASPAYSVFRATADIEPRFLHYLFRTPLFTGAFKTVSRGVVDSRLRLYPDVFFRLPSLLPPRTEQSAIVRFLDHADRRIRRALHAKQKLIALLNEQKQAVIHRAVTCGLDPNVRLKSSGVGWLGDMPEHWEVFQLRRLVRRGRRITYGIVQPGEPDPSGRFMVRGQDYSFGWAEPEAVFRVSDAIESPYKRSRLESGDLVLTIVGAGVGNVAIVPPWLGGANITQTTARISIDPARAEPDLVAAALESPVGRRNVELYVKGAAQPGLNLEHVRLFVIPVPPLPEQREIVTVIRRETDGLAQAVERAHGEIKLLREYRVRLIADVVTGKLDVRETAARLPDEGDEPQQLDEAEFATEVDEDVEGVDLETTLEEVEA